MIILVAGREPIKVCQGIDKFYCKYSIVFLFKTSCFFSRENIFLKTGMGSPMILVLQKNVIHILDLIYFSLFSYIYVYTKLAPAVKSKKTCKTMCTVQLFVLVVKRSY
jgi:hypothetical protein